LGRANWEAQNADFIFVAEDFEDVGAGEDADDITKFYQRS